MTAPPRGGIHFDYSRLADPPDRRGPPSRASWPRRARGRPRSGSSPSSWGGSSRMSSRSRSAPCRRAPGRAGSGSATGRSAASMPCRPRSRRSRSTTSTARSPRPGGHRERGPRPPQADPRRAARAQLTGGRLHQAAVHRRAAAGRAGRADDRRDSEDGRSIGRLARRALMLSGDVTRTAEIAVSDGEDGLRAVGLEIFGRSSRCWPTAASVAEALGGFDRASVEWKLDGIRIQIHRRNDEIRIYPQPQRDHRHAARDRRRGARPTG